MMDKKAKGKLKQLKETIAKNSPDTSEVRRKNLNRITDDFPRY